MTDISSLFIYWQPWQGIYINTYINKKIRVKRGNIYIEGFDPEIALPALPLMETMNDQTHQTRQESEMSEIPEHVMMKMVDDWRQGFDKAYNGGETDGSYNDHIRAGMMAALDGFSVIPKGYVKMPESTQEANAMNLISSSYIEAQKKKTDQ